MLPHHFQRLSDGRLRVRTNLTGYALLNDPALTKDSAFTTQERARFGLDGLLPPAVTTIEDQVRRAHAHIERKNTPLGKYIGLSALQARNETLFFRLLCDFIETYMPVVYTPTVGEATQMFSRIYRRPRGVWITPDDRGRVRQLLANARTPDVRLIVVTDNERILGLGDQGAGGMSIPIGKLNLYSAAAGIHPTLTLPVSLDVGTDNRVLLEDDLYVGWRHPRLRGAAYDELVEEFVEAAAALWPNAVLQWEDFKKGNAFRLLETYRNRIPSFNDDIQGTAAVAVAATMAAARARGERLSDQRIVILGAGAAGVGIASQLRHALVRDGMDVDVCASRIAVLDSRGLLRNTDGISDAYKRPFAMQADLAAELGLDGTPAPDLLRVVRVFKPTVLIGTSGQPGVFTREIAEEMQKHCARPAIFPFSNPTAMSEASPADLLSWTDGAALIATGSPFDPVRHAGRTIRVAQGNNVYVFPGVGLGAIVSRASRITPEMFVAAAETLAGMLGAEDLAEGALFPPLTELRSISRAIGLSVARTAMEQGFAPEVLEEELTRRMDHSMWWPEYPVIELEEEPPTGVPD